MKLTLSKNSLEVILGHYQAFLDKKDSSQITSHIYFQTQDTKLLLRATDYEIAIESKIDIVKKESEGNATVNGRKILEVIKRLKDGEIILESDEEFIHIKQGRSKFKLPMFNASEFPEIFKLEELTKINIDTSKFIQSIRKINPAIETNNQKPELNGALLDIKDYSFNFIATDTRRLAILKYDNPSVEGLTIIIPKKAIIEILKLFYDELEIYCNSTKTQLIIKNNNYTFATKLINGKYPDYEKIIPKNFLNEINLPKDSITDAIKQMNSLSNNIKIIIKPNEIGFETISEEGSELATTQIPEIKTNIESDIAIGANSKYILDFLSQIESSEFKLCLNELNQPFMLKDEKFMTIIMPIIF